MKKIMTLLVLLVPICAVAMRPEEFARGFSTVATSSYSGSSAELANDDDEVAAMIMEGETFSIDMLMDDYLSGDIISEDQRAILRAHLEGLSEDAYAGLISKLKITRFWGDGKAKKEEKIVTALMALVVELKEQTEQMKGSGELQAKALQQQIESAEFAQYKWKNRFWGVIGGAIFTNALQLFFNLWQASNAVEKDTNSSSC